MKRGLALALLICVTGAPLAGRAADAAQTSSTDDPVEAGVQGNFQYAWNTGGEDFPSAL